MPSLHRIHSNAMQTVHLSHVRPLAFAGMTSILGTEFLFESNIEKSVPRKTNTGRIFPQSERIVKGKNKCFVPKNHMNYVAQTFTVRVDRIYHAFGMPDRGLEP